MTNLELMRRRLQFYGGIHQEDRMINGKYKAFLQALRYSYQAASVSLVQKYDECLCAVPILEREEVEPIEKAGRALINPDKLKQDYDDKILSILADGWSTSAKIHEGMTPEEKQRIATVEAGDIFKWRGLDTYWIVYLEELTEDAYFRSQIRRCRYKIKFKDSDGNWLSTWSAIRGPVETQIDSIQKNQVRIDRPNLSLNILIPRNEKTLGAFDRYSEFLFSGRNWQVKAVDTISMKNIIEIAAEEHYIDKNRDDTENEMKDGLVVEEFFDPTPAVLSHIHGASIIKPRIQEEYSVNETEGEWTIQPPDGVKHLPLRYKISKDKSKIVILWEGLSFPQGFYLQWQKEDLIYSKQIFVESLF